MPESKPQRRKTDTWNGKFKALAVGIGWTVTLAGWAYSIGVHTARDEHQERSIEANRLAIEIIRSTNVDYAQDLAVMIEAQRRNEIRIQELRAELREHDRRIVR